MQIRIKSYTFQLSEPFQPGKIITKGEAQALNDLRAENIQNNLRKLVNNQVALLAPDELLAPEVLADLQAAFTAYDQKYKFLERHSPKPRLGEIEEEARLVAREQVEAAARREGLNEPPYSAEQMEVLLSERAALPAVVEEARLRVSARRRVLGEGLESL